AKVKLARQRKSNERQARERVTARSPDTVTIPIRRTRGLAPCRFPASAIYPQGRALSRQQDSTAASPASSRGLRGRRPGGILGLSSSPTRSASQIISSVELVDEARRHLRAVFLRSPARPLDR